MVSIMKQKLGFYIKSKFLQIIFFNKSVARGGDMNLSETLFYGNKFRFD